MADGMTYGGGWGYIDPSLQAQQQALTAAWQLAQLQASMAADSGYYYPAGWTLNDAYQQIWEGMGEDRRAGMNEDAPKDWTDQQKAKRWLEISVEDKVKNAGRDPWRVMEAYGWASNVRQPTLAREKYEAALKANPASMMEYWNYVARQKGLEGKASQDYIAQNVLQAPWVQQFTGQQWNPATGTQAAATPAAATTPTTTAPAAMPATAPTLTPEQQAQVDALRRAGGPFSRMQAGGDLD